jgi:PDZ domain
MHLIRFGLSLLIVAALPGLRLFAQQATTTTSHEVALGAQFCTVPDAVYAHVPALQRGQGLLVESIKAGSRAEEIGLKPYDVVLTVGTTPLKNGEEFKAKLSSLPKGEREVLQIIRAGKPFALTLSAAATTVYAPPKSLFKPGGPPAVSVEIKPLSAGNMEVNLFYLNEANKLDRRALRGSLDEIERQVSELAMMGQMPENIHDLISLALKRARTKGPAANSKQPIHQPRTDVGWPS